MKANFDSDKAGDFEGQEQKQVNTFNHPGDNYYNRNTAAPAGPYKRINTTKEDAATFTIAALAFELPEPMLRVRNDGTVLVQNEAAAALKYFIVNSGSLPANKLWLQLALKKTNSSLTAFNIETNALFSFNAYYNTAGNYTDITGRQMAGALGDERLSGNIRFSNRFVSDLLENLRDGILLEDKNHRLLLVNSSMLALFSYKHDAESLTGIATWKITRNAVDLFKDQQDFLHRTRSLISEGRHSVDEIIALKDGRILKRDFIPLKDHEGKFMGNMWVYSDITDAYAAKKSIEEQRIFFEHIVNNLPVDIVVLDADKRYRFLSTSVKEYNEHRDWIIGKTELEFSAFLNRDKSLALQRDRYFDEVINTKKEIRWEEEQADENGNLHIHLRVLHPVMDASNNLSQLFGYSVEITDRKQIELQVARSEKRYRDLFHLSQGIIVTHNLEGVITGINPALASLVGYSADKLLGEKITYFLPERDKEYFDSYLTKLTREETVEGVFRIIDAGGKKVYLLYKNVLVKEPGAPSYVISFSQDVTQRVLAEKELELARQASEENAKAKERFLANMSHEIRTPMNGIIGIANLLKKTRMNEQQENYLSLILESANNLSVIINDILDLEKINAGKLEFETIPFDLNEKLQVVAESFHYKAEEKNIGLKLNTNLPQNLYVLGDPYRLSQILTNILSNAVKFTQEGEISMDVTCEECGEEELLVTYKISDTGIGISGNKLNAIFDPYTQERSEISRKYGGTGLGLSITKNLVQMQGGVMDVDSTPGKGSVFTIRLKYRRGSKPAEKISAANDYNLLAGKNILVAEDVEINQFLLRHILLGWGCNIKFVFNGKQAVEELKANDYDVILMDIQMPVMDGMQATKLIRAMHDANKAAIPIIALTANALKGDDVKYLAAGMNGYLTKPFSDTSLYTLIIDTLQLRSNHQHVNNKQPGMNDLTNQAAATGKLYDLSSLEAMSGGDENFLPMMAKLFLDTIPGVLEKMEAALKSADWKTVGTQAHKLKPTIDAMNISSLVQVIRQAEQQGKQETGLDTLGEKVAFIAATLRACIAGLKEEFSL